MTLFPQSAVAPAGGLAETAAVPPTEVRMTTIMTTDRSANRCDFFISKLPFIDSAMNLAIVTSSHLLPPKTRWQVRELTDVTDNLLGKALEGPPSYCICRQLATETKVPAELVHAQPTPSVALHWLPSQDTVTLLPQSAVALAASLADTGSVVPKEVKRTTARTTESKTKRCLFFIFSIPFKNNVALNAMLGLNLLCITMSTLKR